MWALPSASDGFSLLYASVVLAAHWLGLRLLSSFCLSLPLSYLVDIAVQDSCIWQVSRIVVATYSDRRLCTDFVREGEGLKFQAYLVPWKASSPDNGDGRFNIVGAFKTSGYCRNLENRRTWYASCDYVQSLRMKHFPLQSFA